jgi:hypothetical protein
MKKLILISISAVLLSAACNHKQTPPAVTQTQALQTTKSPSPTPGTLPPLPLHTVGQISRHASNFLNQEVRMQGYMLKKEPGYILFSDEPDGSIGRFDLPIMGAGIEAMKPGLKYELRGTFLGSGLKASNGNPDHLKLSKFPESVK